MQELKYQEELTYIFPLNETESITFIVQDCKETCLYYDSWATVYFVSNEGSKLLAHDVLCVKISDFVHYLEKALFQQIAVDEQKIPDPGLFFNEMLYRKRILNEMVPSDELYKNVVWSPVIARENIQTWLYKDNLGNIIFFMAPVYPFFFTSKNAKNFKAYSEWIKTYKIVGKYVIDQDTAKQWLEKAKAIMGVIENNSAPALRTNGSV
jgi:hypothetical protein